MACALSKRIRSDLPRSVLVDLAIVDGCALHFPRSATSSPVTSGRACRGHEPRRAGSEWSLCFKRFGCLEVVRYCWSLEQQILPSHMFTARVFVLGMSQGCVCGVFWGQTSAGVTRVPKLTPRPTMAFGAAPEVLSLVSVPRNYLYAGSAISATARWGAKADRGGPPAHARCLTEITPLVRRLLVASPCAPARIVDGPLSQCPRSRSSTAQSQRDLP